MCNNLKSKIGTLKAIFSKTKRKIKNAGDTILERVKIYYIYFYL